MNETIEKINFPTTNMNEENIYRKANEKHYRHRLTAADEARHRGGLHVPYFISLIEVQPILIFYFSLTALGSRGQNYLFHPI